MSKSNVFETDILGLIFNGTAIATLAINATASPLTSLFVALHTADPGEGGTQATNEITYGGYARVAVVRSAGGWVVSGGTVSPVNPVLFPLPSSGAGTIATHASVGTAASGAGKILYKGGLNPAITITLSNQPKILNTSTISED